MEKTGGAPDTGAQPYAPVLCGDVSVAQAAEVACACQEERCMETSYARSVLEEEHPIRIAAPAC
jgi:hypothetical protein